MSGGAAIGSETGDVAALDDGPGRLVPKEGQGRWLCYEGCPQLLHAPSWATWWGTARGECMEPLIADGATVYTDTRATPEPGDVVRLTASRHSFLGILERYEAWGVDLIWPANPVHGPRAVLDGDRVQLALRDCDLMPYEVPERYRHRQAPDSAIARALAAALRERGA
jgi:hypothetical protein